MKPFYHLVLILLSWLVLSLCTSHPTLGRNRTNNNIQQCIDSERDALLQFKHGITQDDCGLLMSWKPHTDCCQWTGVLCSNLTSHVIVVGLGGEYMVSCLEGKLSPSLGELKHLEHLNLSYNNFHGEIPHQLGNLSKLTTLDLDYAYNNVPLQSLSWISRLTLLRYLDLSYANLSVVTNWITIVNSLPSLRVLKMDECQLPVEIPSSLSYVNSSTNIHTISLSSNNFFNSSIFKWMFNLPRLTTQLVHLDVSWNEFQILIPSEFANFHSLSYLDLSGNAFQGSVFKIVSKLCNLEQLYLANNNFTDELSNLIHSLVKCSNKALLTLDLGSNGFWGAIPEGISSLYSLRELYLNGNQLKGEISPGIGQLSMLEILDVSSNSLEGTLTHTLFLNLANLRKLFLSDNLRMSINIDENMTLPFQLDVIGLRSCLLGPKFPKWLQLQTSFSYLDISNTGISDTIPISFWSSLSPYLLYLNMSYNQFYGILPDLINGPEPLAIDLSSNYLQGVAPSWFTNARYYLYLNDNWFTDSSHILCPKAISSLSILDLSDNLFSGELPDCWVYFSQLTSLHLENNNFSGRIPASIGTLLNLQFLHLFNNSFSGQFPVAFESLTSLRILNLGYNLFSGNIPPWIGNAFQSLGALILRKNHFIVGIPESICQLNNLQILDLATNHISGVIPNCIGNFTAMNEITKQGLYFSNDDTILFISGASIGDAETAIVSWKREEQKFKETVRWVKLLDLSGNELRGEIPNGITILNGLESLDLSKNKLSGDIPFEIGNLTALELLDLSNNHLTGNIPISLAKVTTLGIVNVSNNNLSGEIPVSTQLQSFNASSYAGNEGLCGAPLPSCSKDRAPSNVPREDITSVQDKDDDFVFYLGLYISVVLGFIVGFWGVCGTLVIKASWRHAYFRFLDNIKHRIM